MSDKRKTAAAVCLTTLVLSGLDVPRLDGPERDALGEADHV